jgi:hypothetical protein
MEEGLEAEMGREEVGREPEPVAFDKRDSVGRSGGEDVQDGRFEERPPKVGAALALLALRLRARSSRVAGPTLATNGIAAHLSHPAGDAKRRHAPRRGSERRRGPASRGAGFRPQDAARAERG